MLNKENKFFSDETFKLPIEYLKNKIEVSENIKTDLELVETISKDTRPIYHYTFNPKTLLGKLSIQPWSKYFTTNKLFLEDSQKLYKNIQSLPFEKHIIENMLESWNDVKEQTNFLEKYQYIDFNRFKWLNRSAIFLSILSFYNISAPVLQLIAPLFILIIPFVVLKMMNLPISWNSYYKILKENLRNHAVGKLFFSFKNASIGNKLYLLFAAGMFFWNIYQNILSCYRFYINTHYITNKFEIINEYLDYTIEKIKFFYNLTKDLESYKEFNKNLLIYKDKLQKFHNSIRSLPNNKQKLSKFSNIGKLMKSFFVLYDDENINNIINYSLGFHGYIDSIIGEKHIALIQDNEEYMEFIELNKKQQKKLKEELIKLSGESVLKKLKDFDYVAPISIFSQISETVERAYWDKVELDLSEKNFDTLKALLIDIKNMLNYIYNRNEDKKKELDEYFDIDFIINQLSTESLSSEKIVNQITYLYNILKELQAPEDDTPNKEWFDNLFQESKSSKTLESIR